MSATTTAGPVGVPVNPAAAPLTGAPGVPFARLLRVELRKQVDTRASAWLLGVIALVNIGLSALVLVASEPQALTWQELTVASSIGQLLLLPLIGILAATSEWSQRTALTTFVLEPRRTRVNLAKLVAAVVLGLGIMVVTTAAAALLNLVGMLLRDGDGSWALDPGMVAGTTIALVVFVVLGVAFGLVLLSTPVAVVAFLVLPTLGSVLPMLAPALQGPAEWLDVNRTTVPLMEGTMAADDWPRLAVSVAVWVVVPLVLGLWRTARRDIA